MIWTGLGWGLIGLELAGWSLAALVLWARRPSAMADAAEHEAIRRYGAQRRERV